MTVKIYSRYLIDFCIIDCSGGKQRQCAYRSYRALDLSTFLYSLLSPVVGRSDEALPFLIKL